MKYIGIITLFLFSGYTGADVSPAQELEIEHLLKYVEKSSCQLNRNGKFHAGKEAAGHIQRKYEHFKRKIKTTEQFIEYSATKSTMSGELYLVKCGEQDSIKTGDWLLEELKRYRKNNPD